MPFVQGHYSGGPVTAHIESACACCGQPIAFDVDESMRFEIAGDAQPLIFVRLVDFAKLEDPSIIDAF